jgi:hypothetical protein
MDELITEDFVKNELLKALDSLDDVKISVCSNIRFYYNHLSRCIFFPELNSGYYFKVGKPTYGDFKLYDIILDDEHYEYNCSLSKEIFEHFPSNVFNYSVSLLEDDISRVDELYRFINLIAKSMKQEYINNAHIIITSLQVQIQKQKSTMKISICIEASRYMISMFEVIE